MNINLHIVITWWIAHATIKRIIKSTNADFGWKLELESSNCQYNNLNIYVGNINVKEWPVSVTISTWTI